MINLDSILTPSLIIADSDATSKKRVLEQISTLCAGPKEAESFYQLLINREKLGSTALGDGVALPHCRAPFLHQPIGCFIRLQHSIDFDAPDNQGVNLVFGLFVPEKATEAHLEILARIAEIFSQEAVRNKLLQAKSAQEIYHILMHA
jgi:PTS system nitrogen regulatory IIA component